MMMMMMMMVMMVVVAAAARRRRGAVQPQEVLLDRADYVQDAVAPVL